MPLSTAIPRRRGILAGAGIAVAALALAACSSGTTDASGSGETSAPSDEPLQIAYISFAVANTYDEPMLAAAQEVAEANNAEITVFDGNLDPATQATLIEDVIASGDYDDMIVQPIYGPAIMDVVAEAMDAGLTVVNIDQILGEDFTSGAAQLPGLASNIVFVPSILGQKLGEQTVEACASKNLDPCNVAYLHDLKTSSVSIALWDAFSEATAGTPVTVVAEGVLAIGGSGAAVGDYLLVGYGGSQWALDAISEGIVYSDVIMAPATTGRLGMEAMIAALRDGTDMGDVDPFADFPNNGVMTPDTVDQFTGEWPG